MGFGLGGSQNGFSIELAASQNSANGNGSSITHHIFVGNHTQPDGAVIASSATPDKNHLSTGTPGWTDIENHANSGASDFSVAVSGSMGKTTTPASDSFINDIPKSGQPQLSDGNSLPIGTLQQTKDRAISPGTIKIHSPEAQQQDVSQISRDTAAAENALKDKFDAQKAEGSLAIQREMAVLGQQAIQQTFDALKKQEKKLERNQLKNDAAFNELSEAAQKKALDKIDQNVEEKYGIGSKLQIAAQAISGLFARLAAGNVSGADGQQVSQGNEPMRVLLHTLATGVIAKAQGGSAIGGAAGAARERLSPSL